MNKDIAVLREVITKLTPMLAGQGLKVTQRGSRAYVQTDPRTHKPILVNIPHIPDDAAPELIIAVQGFIDHEVGHILFTDWDCVKTAEKKGKQFAAIANLCEDPRVEKEMGKRFPGSKYNVELLHDYFIRYVTKPQLDKVAGDPSAEFGLLLVPLLRAWGGQERFKEFMKGYETHPLVSALTNAMPKGMIENFPKIRSTAEAHEVAQAIFDIIHQPGEGKGEGEESTETAAGSSSSKSKAKPSGDKGEAGSSSDKSKGSSGKSKPSKGKSEKDKGEGDAEDENEEEDPNEDEGEGDDEGSGAGDKGDEGDEGEDESSGSSDDEGDEEEGAGGGAGDEGEEGEEDEGKGKGEEGDDEADESGAVDPGGGGHEGKSSPFTGSIEIGDFDGSLEGKITEGASRAMKDSDYRVFTTDFDKIEPYPVTESIYQDEWFVRLDDKTRHMVGVMQKDIERMMASKSAVVRVPGYRSGRLHSSGLHRMLAGDDRVFRRIHEGASKDTCVGLLVDNSGSMNGPPVEIAMASAYALSMTLERVGIPYECLGFSTLPYTGEVRRLTEEETRRTGVYFTRMEPLMMPIYCGFDERLTAPVRKRFAAVFGGDRGAVMKNNVDGECVQIAGNRLLRRPERRKVLIVLSDGSPACHTNDYPGLNAHAKRVPEELRKKGVETVGIGILDDSVRHFYDRHFVLRSLDALPGTVMGELKRILTA